MRDIMVIGGADGPTAIYLSKKEKTEKPRVSPLGALAAGAVLLLWRKHRRKKRGESIC